MRRVGELLAFFLGAQLLGALLVLLGRLWLPDGGAASVSWTALSLLLANAALLGALWHFRRVRPSDVGPVRLPWRLYGAVFSLLVPAVFLVNLLSEQLSLTDVNGALLRSLMRDPCGVLSITLCAPLAEEMLFRAGIQGVLQRRLSRPWQAVFLSAALFAVAHFNPAQLPAAFLMGLLLGAVYRLTGSLWPAVAGHVFNNALGVGLELCFPQLTSFSSLLGSRATTVFVVAFALVWLLWAARCLWRMQKD